MYSNFKFTHKFIDLDNKETTVEYYTEEISLPEIITSFEHFLMGCQFVFPAGASLGYEWEDEEYDKILNEIEQEDDCDCEACLSCNDQEEDYDDTVDDYVEEDACECSYNEECSECRILSDAEIETLTNIVRARFLAKKLESEDKTDPCCKCPAYEPENTYPCKVCSKAECCGVCNCPHNKTFI